MPPVSTATTSQQVVTEAGPIRVAVGPDAGTHWGAIGFTLLAAATLAFAVPMLPTWSAELLGRTQESPSVPVPTPTPSATPVPTLPPADALRSKWVDQSGTPIIVVGGTTTISFTFRNVGEAAWRKGTPSEARLGIVGSPGYDLAMAVDWPYPERPAVQSEAEVAPGQLATFTFDVRGVSPGVFRLRLRPIVDGVAWLNDEGVYIDVEVR